MKIAITTNSKNMDGDVDLHFGRAPFILIYDLDDDSKEFINNEQNLNQASGVGIQTAQNISKTGAEVVLAGNCGPKAFKTLTAADIKVVIGVSGKIKDAIEKFKKGQFSYVTEANVEGHWS